MDYRANLDTAETYLEAGMKEKGVESLCKIYNSMQAHGVESDRETFLKLTSIMAKVAMENEKEAEAVRFIGEGLSLDPQDCDLLFLKAMLCRDQQRHDEMFAALVSFLDALSVHDLPAKGYKYVNDLSVSMILSNLIPEAYKNAQARLEISAIIKRMSEKTDNPYLLKLAQVVDALDNAQVTEEG